jgi:hemoglobin
MTMDVQSAIAPPASFYERIGGTPVIKEAVERFYRRLVDDPELATYFTGDLTTLKRHQAALLVQVLGGRREYDGRDLAVAHAPLRIPESHFQRVVFYLVGTLWEMGAPTDIVMAVGLTVAGLRDQIVS